MGEVIMPSEPSYDEMAEQVRRYSAIKLRNYVEAIEPYVLGHAGDLEPSARLGPTYLKALSQLGELYRVKAEPKGGVDMIPRAEAEELAAAAAAAAAVQAAQEVRMEVESALVRERFLDRERARMEVLSRLRALSDRA